MINRCDKDMDASMEVEVHGRWVRYEEHVQALAEKDREIEALKKRVQRKPEEWESVCGECNGSGWR